MAFASIPSVIWQKREMNVECSIMHVYCEKRLKHLFGITRTKSQSLEKVVMHHLFIKTNDKAITKGYDGPFSNFCEKDAALHFAKISTVSYDFSLSVLCLNKNTSKNPDLFKKKYDNFIKTQT